MGGVYSSEIDLKVETVTHCISGIRRHRITPDLVYNRDHQHRIRDLFFSYVSRNCKQCDCLEDEIQERQNICDFKQCTERIQWDWALLARCLSRPWAFCLYDARLFGRGLRRPMLGFRSRVHSFVNLSETKSTQ